MADELDLRNWPQLAKVQTGVRMLNDTLRAWLRPEAIGNYFRHTLYETAIEIELLQSVSGNKAIETVAWNVQQLIYLTANGKEPAPYERRQVKLEDAISRELEIFASPALMGFAENVVAIDRFWCSWMPPTLAGQPSRYPPPRWPGGPVLTPHDRERAFLLNAAENAAAWPRTDGNGRDGGAGRRECVCRRRRLCAQLLPPHARQQRPGIQKVVSEICPIEGDWPGNCGRSELKQTDHGRAPTADERSGSGRTFGVVAKSTAAEPESRRDPQVKDAFCVCVYFQLFADGRREARPGRRQLSGMVSDPKTFPAAMLADLIADTACLLVVWPDQQPWLDVYRQLSRMNQVTLYGRQLNAAERGEIDRALGALAPLPAELFFNATDFSATYVDRVRQVGDYFGGRRAGSRAGFEELLRAVLEEARTIVASRNWDDDVAPLANLDLQLRALRRWIAGGRQPTAKSARPPATYFRSQANFTKAIGWRNGLRGS